MRVEQKSEPGRSTLEQGPRRIGRGTLLLTVALGFLLTVPLTIGAQEQNGVINVARGNSEVINHPVNLQRVLVTDPDIADVVTVSAREVVINGIVPGTTTLLFWDDGGQRHSYTVRVTRDAVTLQSELRRIFPDEDLQVAAVGNTIILSGRTTKPQTAERAVALAESLEEGASIVDHLVVPDRGQVLLRVRVAEVGRDALQDLGINLLRIDPFDPRGADEGAIGTGGVTPLSGDFLGGTGPTQTFSDAVNFFLFHESSNVAAFIRALQSEGLFQSLAEPNLMTLPGETASFLAGGEFPFPVMQPGAQAGAVTIQFREFGVRLNFTPTITNAGSIRMEVAPEVSSLDFAGGLTLAGFQVPVVLSRRAETVVEIEDGQTFAIAGLMDNELSESVDRVPFLGDIPILGSLFRSSSFRQHQTELLVLVTPHLVGVDPDEPELPGGEPETWDWFDFMQPPGAEDGTEEGSEDGAPDGSGS